MMKPLLFLTVWCFLLTSASAQRAQAKPPENAAKLMVIGIGPYPPHRYGVLSAKESKEMGLQSFKDEKRGNISSNVGMPSMLPPLPGEIPPSSLLVKLVEPGSKQATDDPSTRSLSVSFNNANVRSGGLVPGGVPLRLFRENKSGGSDDTESYVNCAPLVPRAQYALLLFPIGKGEKCWEPKPVSRLMRLDGEHFPLNSVYLFNSSKQSVRFVMGNATADLAPGSGKSLPIEKAEPKQRLTAVAAKAADSQKYILNTAIATDRNIRALFVFHDADPTISPRKSVSSFRLILPETKPLAQ